MKISTSSYIKELGALTAGIFVSVLALTVFAGDEKRMVEMEPAAEQSAVFLKADPLPLRVSGVVSAADSTVIYAEAAGVVVGLPAREGVRVAAGNLIVHQSTPVADAQAALASAERSLAALQQAQQVDLTRGASQQASLHTYSAQQIALLRSVGNDNRVGEAARSLQTALDQGALTLIEAVNYVSNNRKLFSADGLRLYDSITADLYGQIPNYFENGVVTSDSVSDEDLLAVLDVLRADPNGAVFDLSNALFLVEGRLRALTDLFATAESDVFDRQSSYATSDIQTEYTTMRNQVLARQQSLVSTGSVYQQTLDGVLEEAVTLDTNVAVTAIDKELASLQASYARDIAVQADVVAGAGEAVARASQSLGNIRAPFSGTVSRVFVNEGEYVMPGTPLLTLIGSGARELEVSVPAYLLPQVAIGQAFVVGGETVGFVDRFSTISEGNSGVVVITLSGDQLVGVSLSGSLQLDVVEDVYQVPRAYVHFDATGPHLVFAGGEQVRAEVVYDTGSSLYLRVVQPSEAALVPAVSITL